MNPMLLALVKFFSELEISWKHWNWDNRSWLYPIKSWLRSLYEFVPRKVLWQLTANLPFREITDGIHPYLERYFLKETKKHIYVLHHFIGNDPDRGTHTHKWFAWSFVLIGWYWEEYRWSRHKVRWFNRITPDTRHRVDLAILDNPFALDDCWTLFVYEKKVRSEQWGFDKPLEGGEFPEGSFIHIPYQYELEGNQTDWWLTAKPRPKDRPMYGFSHYEGDIWYGNHD